MNRSYALKENRRYAILVDVENCMVKETSTACK